MLSLTVEDDEEEAVADTLILGVFELDFVLVMVKVCVADREAVRLPVAVAVLVTVPDLVTVPVLVGVRVWVCVGEVVSDGLPVGVSLLVLEGVGVGD